LGQVKQEQHLE